MLNLTHPVKTVPTKITMFLRRVLKKKVRKLNIKSQKKSHFFFDKVD